MTTLQGSPFDAELLGIDEPTAPRTSSYDAELLQADHTPLQVATQMASQPTPERMMLNALQQVIKDTIPPERMAIIGDIPVGLGRGIAGLFSSAGGLGQMVTDQVERLTGENFATRQMRMLSELDQVIGEFGKAALPRSKEDGLSARAVTGDIAESIPALAATVGAAALTGGGSIPIQLGVMSGTAGMNAAGNAYLSSYSHFKSQNLSDEEAANKAAVEAGAAGIISAGTNVLSSWAMFAKIPGAEAYLTTAARAVAARMTVNTAAGGVQALVERTATDAMTAALRDDPEMAAKIWNGDPEYWHGVMREVLASAGSGAIVSGGHEAIRIASGEPLTPGLAKEIQRVIQRMQKDSLEVDTKQLPLPAAKLDSQGRIVVQGEPSPAKPPDILVTLKPRTEQPGDVVTPETPTVPPEATTPRPLTPDEHAAATEIVANMIEAKADPDSGIPLTEGELIKAQAVKEALERSAPVTEKGSGDPSVPPAEGDATETTNPTGDAASPAEADATTTPTDTNPRRGDMTATTGIKGSIRRMIMGPRALITKTEPQLLRMAMRAQAKGAKAGDAAARREAAAKMQQAVERQRTAADQAMRAAVSKVQTAAIAKTGHIGALKGELIAMIREHLPANRVPKELVTQIGRVNTYGTLAAGIRKVKGAMAAIEHEDAIAHLRKVMTSVEPAELRPQFRDAFETLTDNLALTGVSEETQARLTKLRDFLNANPDADVPTRVTDELDRLGKTALNELDTQDAIDIADKLAMVLQSQRLFNKLDRQRSKREIAQLTEGVLEEVSPHLEQRRVQKSGRIAPIRSGSFTAFGRLIYGAEENLTLDVLAELISGSDQSLTHQILYQAVADGQHAAMRGFFEASDAFTAIIQEQGLELGSRELGAYSAELARRHGIIGTLARMLNAEDRLDTTATIHALDLPSGQKIKLTKSQRMFILASLRDSDTRDLLVFEGNPIHIAGNPKGETMVLTPEDIQHIVDSATPTERAIVDKTIAYLAGPLREVTRRWSIHELGFDITKKGDYFPRHRVVDRAAEDIHAAKFVQHVVESAGIVQPRTGGRQPLEIHDFFVEVNNLFWQSNAIAHLGPPIKTARSVFSRGPVHDMLSNSQRARTVDFLNQTFDAVAKEAVGGPSVQGMVEDGMRGFVNNLGKGLLGLNPTVALYQPISIIAAIDAMPAGFIASAVSRGAMFDHSIDSRIRQNPYLRFRAEASTMGLVFEGGLGQQTFLGFKGRGENVMALLRIMDNYATRVIWRGAELQAAAEGLKGGDAQARASEIAEMVVKRTQPTFDSLHVTGTALNAKSSVLAKMFTFFRAQVAKMENQIGRRLIRIKNGEGSRLKHAGHISTLILSNAIGVAAVQELRQWAIRGFKGRPDGESEIQDWVIRMVRATSQVPMFGSLFSGMVIKAMFPEQRVFDPDLSPLTSIIEDSTVNASAVINGVRTDADAEQNIGAALDLGASLAALKGIPISSPVHDAKAVYKELVKDQQPGGGAFTP